MTANVPAQSLSAALTRYHYDTSYQLTRAEYPPAAPFNGEWNDWSYDAIGNRVTSAMNGGAAINYTYQKIGTNPNNWQRMLTAGGPTHTYDANGRTTSDGVNTYGWDYDNRMKSITGSVSATYKYDYQGRRTSKTVAGTTTTYLYDGLNLIAEAGATPTEYVFGPGIDEPLALSRGGTVSYYSVDALGSVALVSDPTGATQNSYTYDAWGVPRTATELVPQPFRYTSREKGDAANQWFYRARFYAAPTGRFLSEDPLRVVWLTLVNGSQHLYEPADRTATISTWIRIIQPERLAFEYGANNPLSFSDALGWCPMPVRMPFLPRNIALSAQAKPRPKITAPPQLRQVPTRPTPINTAQQNTPYRPMPWYRRLAQGFGRSGADSVDDIESIFEILKNYLGMGVTPTPPTPPAPIFGDYST